MITLRSYQNEAVASVFDYYQNGGNGHIVLALPTGTGKSLILAELIRLIFKYFPSQRVMALTHVQELIEQNSEELLKVWPLAPLGINSAGLKRRDTVNPIIYGGVASVINNIEMFGHRDLLFIDECHLLSPDENGRYLKIIAKLKAINPKLKVIGLTATMFRLGQGLLTQDGLFTDCPFNICTVEGFHRLIIEGFLSPPIPQTTKTELNVDDVKIAHGEYNLAQLQAAVDKPNITQAALRELCERAYNRRAWLIFSSGIEHSEHCAETLNLYGIPAAAIHSGITSDERKQRIADFKAGKLRALTNNNVLTTGFNDPRIDVIGMLRPTVSPGLWVQMLGRGTRPFEGWASPHDWYKKPNCLVLDFAGNSKRLGPIDDPCIPKPKSKTPGDMPVKICEACGTYNHTRVRYCINCGEEFEFKQKITRKSATEQLLTGGPPKVESYDVGHVLYRHHLSRAGNNTLKVTYHCGMQRFDEFVNFDAASFGKHQAHEWWRLRSADLIPTDTNTAVAHACMGKLRIPKRIRVWVNQKYPKVVGVEW